MARTIEAYKLRTELSVDSSKGSAAIKSFQKDVDAAGGSVKNLGKTIDDSGKKAGSKFGEKFSAGATAVITGNFDKLGETLGSIIGTAMAPGIGTAIGGTVGGMLDKMASSITPLIKQGLDLNKMLEQTSVEFTTFAGSAKAATDYLENLKKFAHETGTDLGLVVETSEKLYDLTGNLELSTKILKAATDQAADFGGSAEVITKVADALGLVAEKGELAARDLKTLYKLGVDAKKYLGEATGMSSKQIAKLIAQGRIRGDVATQLISEGIERQKGGFAAKLADTTAGGAERKFGVGMQLTEIKGTEELSRGMKEMYTAADKVLSSDTAKDLVEFMNRTAGQMVDFAKSGIMGGISLAQGVAEGVTGNDSVKAVSQSVNDLGDYLTRQFYTFFGIKSPSTLMIKEVGIPIGQGIANGVGQGFAASFGMARDQIVQTLEGLLQDPKIQALLATIQTAEGGKLNVMAGGRTVLSGAAHPGEIVPSSQWFQGSKGPSSAAGLFQITRTNWRSIAPKLGLNNFSDPHQQQLAALYLMSQHTGGLEALTSGDPSRMMGLAAKDWSSTPGQHIGGGRAWSSDRWLGQFNKSLGGGGAMPVSVVQWGGQDIQGQGAAIFGAGAGAGGQQDISGAAKTVFGRSPGVLEATADIQTFTQTINDTIPVVVDAERAQEDLLQTDTKHDAMLARRSTLMLKATTPLAALTDAEQKHADGAIAITKAYQEAAKKQLIIGRDIVTELSGALGQVAGMAPTETVGKKRGLFSKILGIAAPFLSLLPGGGLISTIAGIASAGLGGNWSGAITGLAGGLAAGGALRPAPKDESSHLPGLISSSATPMATSIDLKPLIPRQSGGPVYRGHTYLVGERQPELLTPGFNGYVSPSAGAGGGDAGGIAAAAAELRAAVAHLNSMPAHHVVMSGARGLVRAMDHDAGLIRLVSQRQRLA